MSAASFMACVAAYVADQKLIVACEAKGNPPCEGEIEGNGNEMEAAVSAEMENQEHDLGNCLESQQEKFEISSNELGEGT